MDFVSSLEFQTIYESWNYFLRVLKFRYTDSLASQKLPMSSISSVKDIEIYESIRTNV